MLLNNISNRRKQARNIFTVHPSAAPWIENRLQLLYDKGNIPAAPEYCTYHPRKRYGPCVMFEVFGIYEYLEGAAPVAVQGVVDGYIDGVVRARPFQLVGEARQDCVARLRQSAGKRGLGSGERKRKRRLQRLGGGWRRRKQNLPGHRVRPVCRAPFQPQPVCIEIKRLEILERYAPGAIYGFRDRGVHMALKRGLHEQVLLRGEPVRRHKRVREGRIGGLLAIEPHRVVLDGLVMRRTAGVENAAAVLEIEDRLDPARYIARKQ